MGSYSEPDLGDIGGVCGLTEAYTPELREKMVRLDKENQILRKRLESVESAPLEGGCVYCKLLLMFLVYFVVLFVVSGGGVAERSDRTAQQRDGRVAAET